MTYEQGQCQLQDYGNKDFRQIVGVLYIWPDDAGCTHLINLVGAIRSREQAQLKTCLCLGLKGDEPKNVRPN